MATLLHRLGRSSARHRWPVLGVWALLLAVVAGLALGLPQNAAKDSSFSIPGTQASAGLDVLQREFSAAAGGSTATIAFQAPAGATFTGEAGAADAAALQDVLTQVRALDGVVSVTDPLDPRQPRVSADQRVAASTVTFDGAAGEVPTATVEAFERLTDREVPAGDGAVRVEAASQFDTSELSHTSEAVGVGVAFLVLVLTYASLAAAGANLLTALVGVGLGVLGITALGKVVPLSTTTPALAGMLGLAVGIDYALFVFARTRTELRRGLGVQEAVAKATGTAGTAVVFAGTTVVVALVGLAVVDIPFLTQMGIAAAATVAVAVLVALTAVPAALAVLGTRVLPKRERERDPAQLRAEAARRDGATDDLAGPGLLGRWVRAVVRRPVLALLAAVVVVGIVAVPFASMRTALPSAETKDPASSARQAYDLLSDAFGPGSQSTLVVVVDGTDAARAAAAATQVVTEVQGLDDVALVTPPVPSQDGTAQLVTVVPDSGPTDERTSDLVRAIRAATGGTAGADVLVTGQTALDIDVTDSLNDALPVYVGVIVLLALVLLVLLFRSILVPLLATLGFLLSLGAALGAAVAIYQWGWLADVFAVAQPAPLLSFMPVLVVGILFGLAMDYQMFLVSAIHEQHSRGRSTRDAVLAGFRQSAPVVVAAAFIMAGVFVGFATSGDAIIGSIGTALTVGVLVDALVVRMVIVPAALTLLGEAAWWMPRWLQRIVPDVDAEGRGLEAALAAAGDGAPAGVPAPRAEAAATAPGTPATATATEGPAVEGTVTDGAGRPLGGAVLTVTDHSGRQLSRTASGADGSYRLPLEVGGTFVLVVAARGTRPLARLVAVADRAVRRDVRLAGDGQVRGRVLGRDDAPGTGVVLTLLDERGSVVGTTRTDEEGRYRFEGLTDGGYVLSVLSGEHRPLAQPVQLEGGAAADVDVRLVPGGRVAGTVTAASDGRGVAEASVVLVDDGGEVVASATTSPDGTFTFGDLDGGRYVVTASGYAPVAEDAHVEDGGETRVDVRLGGRG